MNTQFTDMVDYAAKAHLKPEHAKWLRDNYAHPDTEGLAKAAALAAKEHPEVVASTAAEKDALRAVMEAPDDQTARQNLSSASEAGDATFGRILASHFGAKVDEYVAGTSDRELKSRVDKATAAGNAAPITQKPNGKYVAGCFKCNGTGVVARHMDYAEGQCFDCKGLGYSKNSAEYSSHEEARKAIVEGRVAQATQPVAPRPEPTRAVETPAPKAKGFANKYPGNCLGCGTRVGTGEGITSKGAGGWEVRCVGCHHG